ncbi:UNVERIFIED_CONTAM: hypothetical protein GTU68_043937, partial [Idotea baltica]|nr:hypothetical protein [Idotea baltica]
MDFIDLFSGLGGFHVGLSRAGGNCVFASEKNHTLRKLYERNFNLFCHGDISDIPASIIPEHDILCAGFPCQPFSKAGEQDGLNDVRGNLFYEISRILEYHNPKYFILENVPNLLTHDNGNTFSVIKHELENKLNYKIKYEILSPHEHGIPQIRKRIFIIGSRDHNVIDAFKFPVKSKKETSIKSILDKKEYPS